MNIVLGKLMTVNIIETGIYRHKCEACGRWLKFQIEEQAEDDLVTGYWLHQFNDSEQYYTIEEIYNINGRN